MGYGPKIFIGSVDNNLKKRLKTILKKQGYNIIGEAEDGNTALRMIRRLLPDLVILDKGLPGMSGMELAQIIEEDKIAPVIILTASWEKGLFEKANESSEFAFLVKPIQEGHLLSMASFVIHAFHKMLELRKEVDDLKETLETRKMVERAKGVLMKNMNISEEEAFKCIQNQSMDKCIPMKQVAEAIILTYDIKKKKKK